MAIKKIPLFTNDTLAGLSAVLCDECYKLNQNDFFSLLKNSKMFLIDLDSTLDLRVYNTLVDFQKSKGFSNNIYHFIGETFRVIKKNSNEITALVALNTLNYYLANVNYQINHEGSFIPVKQLPLNYSIPHNLQKIIEKDLGYVYIIGNTAMLGLYKIGYTNRRPQNRANELNNEAKTGMPGKYNVLFELKTTSPRKVEQFAHRLLIRQRFGKEWFKCSSITDCINAINTAFQQVGGKEKTVEAIQRAEIHKNYIIETAKKQIELERKEFERKEAELKRKEFARREAELKRKELARREAELKREYFERNKAELNRKEFERKEFEQMKVEYNTVISEYHEICKQEHEKAFYKTKKKLFIYALYFFLICLCGAFFAQNKLNDSQGAVILILVGTVSLLSVTLRKTSSTDNELNKVLENSPKVKQSRIKVEQAYRHLYHKFGNITDHNQVVNMTFDIYKSHYKN